MGSYGPTERCLWLVGKISLRTWEDCRCTFERAWPAKKGAVQCKKGVPSRGSVVHIRTMTSWTCSLNWPLRGRTAPIWKNSSRGTWVKVLSPALIVVSREGPRPPLIRTRVEVKGDGTLHAMSEAKPTKGVPPPFWCKPVNDKGEPCHAASTTRSSWLGYA